MANLPAFLDTGHSRYSLTALSTKNVFSMMMELSTGLVSAPTVVIDNQEQVRQKMTMGTAPKCDRNYYLKWDNKVPKA